MTAFSYVQKRGLLTENLSYLCFTLATGQIFKREPCSFRKLSFITIFEINLDFKRGASLLLQINLVIISEIYAITS